MRSGAGSIRHGVQGLQEETVTLETISQVRCNAFLSLLLPNSPPV